MKKCLIIINNLSGRANSVDIDAIKDYIGKDYLFDCQYFEGTINFYPYDTLAVCGGDGTLSSIVDMVKDIDINIIYFPFGTVNDRAKTAKRHPSTKYIIGNINGKTFTYVAACGTFTAIGYLTHLEKKRKYKALAYLLQAFSQYKIHRIKAKITTDTHTFDGEYTLIMIIKSKHCFYFPFNKLYNSNQLNAHLLLIKSPKKEGFVGNIQLFFCFFRVFFIGLRKELHKKYITFIPFSNLFINLPDSTDFCIDGEKQTLSDNINVNLRYACPSFKLAPRKTSKHKKVVQKLSKQSSLTCKQPLPKKQDF